MAKKILEERICPACGNFFQPHRKNMRYCNTKCYFKLWAKAHPRVDIDKIKNV